MTTFETRPSLQILPRSRSLEPPAPTEPAPRNLMEAVQEAVRTVAARTPLPSARADAGLVGHPHSLLALLTYCYARGVYGSREIEDTLWQDGTLREMSGREIPHARTLRRFRRDHPDEVYQCLKIALAFHAGLGSPDLESDAWAGTQLAEEAKGRLMKAVFIDHMELEDGDF